MTPLSDSPPEGSKTNRKAGLFLRTLAWGFHWFAPAYASLVAGDVASAAAASILQLGAAVGVWLTLQETEVSPLFVTALWLLGQTGLAAAFNIPGPKTLRSPTWSRALGCALGAATLLLVVMAWSPWTLVSLASTPSSSSIKWVWVRKLPNAVQRGDWVAVRCDDQTQAGLFRVLALPGETYWFRAGSACFSGSGCLPLRPLKPYDDQHEAGPTWVTLAGSKFYVTRGPSSVAIMSNPHTPIQLDEGSVGLQADGAAGQSDCLASSSTSLDRVLGSVVWLGLTATRRASDSRE